MDTRFTSHMLCPPPYACAILYYANKYQATLAICFGLVRSHQHDKADDKQERGLINVPRFSFETVPILMQPMTVETGFFFKVLRH